MYLSISLPGAHSKYSSNSVPPPQLPYIPCGAKSNPPLPHRSRYWVFDGNRLWQPSRAVCHLKEPVIYSCRGSNNRLGTKNVSDRRTLSTPCYSTRRATPPPVVEPHRHRMYAKYLSTLDVASLTHRFRYWNFLQYVQKGKLSIRCTPAPCAIAPAHLIQARRVPRRRAGKLQSCRGYGQQTTERVRP